MILNILRYEGEKVKGLYHGEGKAFFYGGNHYKVNYFYDLLISFSLPLTYASYCSLDLGLEFVSTK